MSLVAAVLEPADGIGPADEVHRAADRRVERIVRTGAEFLQDRLQLAPAELDRVQVRRVGRQVQDGGASRRYEAPDVRRLVGADVVEDDDVAGPQLADQHALEKGLEDFAVGRALDRHHRAHAGHVERANHRGDSARVAGHRPQGSLATRRPRVVARHCDVAARLIDEDEAARIERLGEIDEPAPQFLDPRLGLLGCGQALFFRVSASLSRIRFIEDRLTLRPVRRWNSHATSWSVRSAFSSMIARTTAYCSGATRGGFPPPPRFRSSEPVSRFRRFQRWTVASPTLKIAATCSSVMSVRSNAATTRSRRSTEYAHPIAASRPSSRRQQIKNAGSRQLGSAVRWPKT